MHPGTVRHGTVCTYVQYVLYSINSMYSMSVRMYICMKVFTTQYLVQDTWYASICIRMHPDALHMHPSCVRMHPYASISLHDASERQYSTHSFAAKIANKCRIRKTIVVLCTNKSVRIQPKVIKVLSICTLSFFYFVWGRWGGPAFKGHGIGIVYFLCLLMA